MINVLKNYLRKYPSVLRNRNTSNIEPIWLPVRWTNSLKNSIDISSEAFSNVIDLSKKLSSFHPIFKPNQSILEDWYLLINSCDLKLIYEPYIHFKFFRNGQQIEPLNYFTNKELIDSFANFYSDQSTKENFLSEKKNYLEVLKSRSSERLHQLYQQIIIQIYKVKPPIFFMHENSKYFFFETMGNVNFIYGVGYCQDDSKDLRRGGEKSFFLPTIYCFRINKFKGGNKDNINLGGFEHHDLSNIINPIDFYYQIIFNSQELSIHHDKNLNLKNILNKLNQKSDKNVRLSIEEVSMYYFKYFLYRTSKINHLYINEISKHE